MPSILSHFDALTNQGLKVIPLRQNTKIPISKNWTENWDHHLVRQKIKQYPNSNIGILLGDIVDVEGDSEYANETILNLIKDYPHPTYRSSKSIHHLFLTPDETLRHFRYRDIEFRGHGHQSVLPPSVAAGVVYKWLARFKFPVPPMPEELTLFLERKRKKKVKKDNIKPDHMQINCCTCDNKCYLHKRRFELELEAFKLLGQKWECQNCRSIDLRPACRLIRMGVDKKVILINALDRF